MYKLARREIQGKEMGNIVERKEEGSEKVDTQTLTEECNECFLVYTFSSNLETELDFLLTI